MPALTPRSGLSLLLPATGGEGSPERKGAKQLLRELREGPDSGAS